MSFRPAEEDIRFINYHISEDQYEEWYRSKPSGFKVKKQDGELYYHDHIVVNPTNVRIILDEIQASLLTMKMSPARLYEEILTRGMLGISRRRIEEYFQLNDESAAVHRQQKHRVYQPILSKPFSRIQIDLILISGWAKSGDSTFKLRAYNNNDNNKYVLNVVDHFSKFLWSYPLKEKTAIQVNAVLFPLLVELKAKGFSVLQSDHGKEFTSNDLEAKLTELGYTHLMGKAYNAQSNGGVERLNSSLKRLMYKALTTIGNMQWVDILAAVVENYNNTPHTSLKGHTPSEVYHHLTPALQAEITESQKEKAKAMVNANVDIEPLKLNDLVRVSLTPTNNGMPTNTFSKSYLAKNSEDIYVVTKIKTNKYGEQLLKITLDYKMKYKLQGLRYYEEMAGIQKGAWNVRGDLILTAKPEKYQIIG